MTPDGLLKVLLPFVPPGKRSLAGLLILVGGGLVVAASDPGVAPLLPAWAATAGKVAAAWGGVVYAAGLRAAIPSAPEGKGSS